MTIDEAISYLKREAELCEKQPETGVGDAIKLGIEALKEIKHLRTTRISKFHRLIGETES